MKYNIPNPCPANWDEMKVGIVSRHCDHCQKDVMDFSEMRREEIINYLLSHANRSTCGRIKNGQLDFKAEEILIAVRKYLSKNPNSKLSFMVLAIGAMLAASCQSNTSNNPQRVAESPVDSLLVTPPLIKGLIQLPENDSAAECTKTDSIPANKPTDHSASNIDLNLTSEIGEVVITGDVMIDPEPIDPGDTISIRNTANPDTIIDIPENFAEYPGGTEALFTYIYSNLKITPDQAPEDGRDRRIFVSFIVELDGSTSNMEVLRDELQNTDVIAEIERVILNMPPWKPAHHLGRDVRSIFRIPIRIRFE